jgi:hypothetical protein
MPRPRLRPLCCSVAAASLLTGALAACARDGGDAGAGGDDSAATCTALDHLAAHAVAIERIDVKDPDAYTRALDDEVDDYMRDLAQLRGTAPDSLHGAIDSLSTTVRRRDFDAAARPRDALEVFATKRCNAPAPTTSRG